MTTTLWDFVAGLTLWQAALLLLLWLALRAGYALVRDAYRLAKARDALQVAREHAVGVANGTVRGAAAAPQGTPHNSPTVRQTAPANRAGYQA